MTERQKEILAEVAKGTLGRSRSIGMLYQTWCQGRNVTRQVRALQERGLIELDWEAAKTAHNDPWRLTAEGRMVVRRMGG